METYQIALWAIGILVVALVVVYALRKGYNVTLKRKNIEARFQKNTTASDHPHIGVGEEMRIKNSKTGDISGIKATASGGSPAASEASVDVLQKAEIDDSETGDISGIKNEP